jgi:hypothetical protein
MEAGKQWKPELGPGCLIGRDYAAAKDAECGMRWRVRWNEGPAAVEGLRSEAGGREAQG